MSRPPARFFRSGTRSAIRASSFSVRLTPAKVQRGQQVGELFAVEDHAVEDGVDEALQRSGGRPCLCGERRPVRAACLLGP